ncbi:hypothetical protein GBAR_LOCUS7833, partial [Geodia barretti]
RRDRLQLLFQHTYRRLVQSCRSASLQSVSKCLVQCVDNLDGKYS